MTFLISFRARCRSLYLVRNPAIVALRGLARDMAVGNIVGDRLAVAFLGWAIAAGAGQAEAQHVAQLDLARLLGMQPIAVALECAPDCAFRVPRSGCWNSS